MKSSTKAGPQPTREEKAGNCALQSGKKADKIKIVQEEQENEYENIIIGIYNKSLTKRGEYRALIGLELLH